MTKSQEIEILRETAHKLGSASYLGPWLERAIPSLKHEIAMDIFPLSYGEAEKIAERTISDAEMKACQIIANAAKDCTKMRNNAQLDIDRMKKSAREALQDIAENV